jgi:hypothetical protein
VAVAGQSLIEKWRAGTLDKHRSDHSFRVLNRYCGSHQSVRPDYLSRHPRVYVSMQGARPKLRGTMSKGDSLPKRYPGEYATWVMMRQRCENPNQADFHHYGGRGIKVCKRWSSFAAFMEDMGPRPKGLALVRKTPDSHFWPSTCRWSPRGAGAQQRRGTKLTIKDARRIRARYRRGETRTDLAREYGVSLTHVCMIVSGDRWRDPEESRSRRKSRPRSRANSRRRKSAR